MVYFLELQKLDTMKINGVTVIFRETASSKKNLTSLIKNGHTTMYQYTGTHTQL